MTPHSPLPTVEGGFRTLVVDPPWRYGDKLPGRGRGAEKHYQTMSTDEVVAMRDAVLAVCAEDVHLYLWTTSSFMEDAHRVFREWGFNPRGKQILTWVKQNKAGDGLAFGMGWNFRNVTEHCLFGTRGRTRTLLRNVRNVIVAPRGPHSAKPDEFYEVVRRQSPGPRLELFSRQVRDGFVGWGLEHPEA